MVSFYPKFTSFLLLVIGSVSLLLLLECVLEKFDVNFSCCIEVACCLLVLPEMLASVPIALVLMNIVLIWNVIHPASTKMVMVKGVFFWFATVPESSNSFKLLIRGSCFCRPANYCQKTDSEKRSMSTKAMNLLLELVIPLFQINYVII